MAQEPQAQSGGALAEYSVYTIKAADKLEEDFALARKELKYDEDRSWVTAGKLWRRASEVGKPMPVLFADAAHDCSRLLFWGVLTNVRVRNNKTFFTVDRLRKVERGRKTQELVLRSTGQTISPRFIKPYAICLTPNFLR